MTMPLTSGYPVMIFGENMAPEEHQSDASFGLLPSAVKSLQDLKPIIHSQQDLTIRQKICYSLLISFLKPTPASIRQTVRALQHPEHALPNLREMPMINDPSFWVEMRVTSAGGYRCANLVMPAGMGEAAAVKKPDGDFNFLIIGQALTHLYQSSLENLALDDMRCVIPLAEIRVRDIVSYRNTKLGLKQANIQNVTVRGDNVQGPNRREASPQPILAFCAVCIKLSDKHRRCGGCKVRSLRILHVSSQASH